MLFKENKILSLIERGVIVKLVINRWRGHIDPFKFVDDFITVDNRNNLKDLKNNNLPESINKKLARIERLARLNLINYSFDTTWGKFVPYTCFNKWSLMNSDIKNQFVSFSEEIAINYLNIKSEMKNVYSDFAKQAWHSIHDDKGDPSSAFTESFANRLIDGMPSRIEILSEFKYDCVYLTLPSSFFSEGYILNSNNNLLNNDCFIDFQQEIYKAKDRVCSDFMTQTVFALQNYIFKSAKKIKSLMMSNAKSKIQKNEIDSIKKMILHFNDMNFYEDDFLKPKIDLLHLEINKKNKERDKDKIIYLLSALEKINL